ncbi:MAG: ATP synthase F1 subunit gamma [Planctomycetota bacterium]|nr:MAG: ATP synthase F1 subunit gamma [Planctomycetota bacterium]REJ90459.1 MAG: ATP synthase F1 subunit gamma [Planctomycetota bacterium]REK26242.1 MAG: ATP synthase F1 subunit gamma [Planctomycetota bacterium]REK34374.1 MAG: ATP synthase F1 subunit gamma [Planctomycetota bacterium]
MANARALVKRRKAVRNIRKITRTMELIATARFKKAMDRATEAAAYTRKINEIVADLSQADLAFAHPLLQKPAEETHVAVLVLTSNRGLCGGYNGAILRQAGGRLRELDKSGKDVTLEVSGKRGLAYFKYEGIPVDRSYTQFEDKPAFDEVNEIASRFVSEFIAGRLHRLDVVYQKFESAARQAPAVETLLPIGDLASGGESGANGREVDYEFLPSAQEILDEIVPAAFKARFFKCFLDAAVGEQIARRVAMKAATENADEMIRSISQQYNRARQTQITSELAEIIGGAAALE